MTITVALTTPIEAHGDTLSALTLREPSGKDIRTNGMPFRMNADDNSIVIDAAVAHRYISSLSSVPPSTVDRLTPADWWAATSAVLGFFGMASSS